MSRTYDNSIKLMVNDLQTIAVEILEFRPHLPAPAAELHALVPELYAVIPCLQDLQRELHHPPNFEDVLYYAVVVRSILQAITQTLKDLDYHLNDRNRPRRESRRLIWEELNEFFLREDDNTLLERMRYFRMFLQEFITILAG